jgi:hypothetical protein
MKAERKPPGLPSVYKAREDRQRGRYSRTSPGLWLWATGAIVAIVVGYHFVSARQLDEARQALLSKQRAVGTKVGSEWFPLRDRIEQLTLDAALPWESDRVAPDASHWDFRSLPGLYLRLRVDEAKDVEGVRRAATSSQKDGFVGCLLREPNPGGARGELDGGAFSEQPWNWQKAYQATRILTDEWTHEVEAAQDSLRLRVFEQQYNDAVSTEIPLAIEVVKRAQFFLLVLDEDSDEAKLSSEGGAVTEALLQRVPHYARVHLVNLRTNQEVVRVRRTAEASFVFAGESNVHDPETLDAMRRQVNNCALARQVDSALSTGADAGTE